MKETTTMVPAKKAPAKAAPVSETVKAAPAKKAPAKAAPAKKTSAQTPAKKAPAKAAPTKAAPAKKAPAKAPAKAAPAKKTPAKAVDTTAATRPTDTAQPAGSSTPVEQTPDALRESEWSAAELAEIRTELVAELDQMRAAYDSSVRELNDLQLASGDAAGDDQADAGSKAFEREQEQSIAANRLDLLSQIQRAVERIDEGRYGFCESCGKPIPKARLRAFPSATLDVACKQREERR